MKTLKALLTKITDTPSRHKLRQERMFWAEEKADLTHERNRNIGYQRQLHEASEAEWREQMTELVNEHCDERRKWAREKRELIELEQQARQQPALKSTAPVIPMISPGPGAGQ